MQRSLVVLVLVVVVAIAFAPIVIGKTWDDIAYHTEVAPSRLAAADAIVHGKAATWWEGSGLGVPLLGEPSHGAAYPLTWWAGTPRAFDLAIVLHVLWCALGVAWWARRRGASALGAALAGTLAVVGLALVRGETFGAVVAVAHLPWLGVAAQVERGRTPTRGIALACLGGFVGLIALSGQLVIAGVAVALALALTRDRFGAIAAAGGILVGSLQWLPAVFVARESAAVQWISPAQVFALLLVAPACVLAAFGQPRWQGRRPWALGAVGMVAASAAVLLLARTAEPPTSTWARLALATTPQPARVYRPIMSFEGARPVHVEQTLDEAVETLAGTSAAIWGLGTARSEDPARLAIHDRVWMAAAGNGGALLARYGISLAILPASRVAEGGFQQLGTRGDWTLARFPASPAAALVHEWLYVADTDKALARLFPPGTRGLDPGLVVLAGKGTDNQDEPSPPTPCTIERWAHGWIDLSCTADRPAYAVVSSAAARGWTVTVDRVKQPWATVDVMRRGVALTPGTHHITWRYRAPGLRVSFLLVGAGIGGLFALWLWAWWPSRRSRLIG